MKFAPRIPVRLLQQGSAIMVSARLRQHWAPRDWRISPTWRPWLRPCRSCGRRSTARAASLGEIYAREATHGSGSSLQPAIAAASMSDWADCRLFEKFRGFHEAGWPAPRALVAPHNGRTQGCGLASHKTAICAPPVNTMARKPGFCWKIGMQSTQPALQGGAPICGFFVPRSRARMLGCKPHLPANIMACASMSESLSALAPRSIPRKKLIRLIPYLACLKKRAEKKRAPDKRAREFGFKANPNYFRAPMDCEGCSTSIMPPPVLNPKSDLSLDNGSPPFDC